MGKAWGAMRLWTGKGAAAVQRFLLPAQVVWWRARRAFYAHPWVVAFGASIRRAWDREPWWAEFWSGMNTLLWSVWPYLFGNGMEGRPVWWVPIATMDPETWQIAGFALGVGKLTSLFYDTSETRIPRRVAAFMGTTWWTFLALSLFVSDRGAPSVPLYIVPIFVNLYSLVRLGVWRPSACQT